MKKADKDFAIFQREFKRWQQKFGLGGYNVFFKHEPLGDAFADIFVKQPSMTAVVTLNSKLHKGDKPFKDIKGTAKHEALHLLLSRLTENGRFRFITENEMTEACEELVYKLEALIP